MTTRYSGFLSYSRRDEPVAAWLSRRLEGWRPPRNLRRQTGIDRIRIFRDIEDAELGELSEVIRRALAASDHLILLCSPASRASAYVALEIEAFAEAHGADRILPVLVAGRPNNEVADDDPHQDQAFPEALLRLYDEPLAADLRPRPGERRARRKQREREAFFQIVARLLGIGKSDELVRRDRLQRRLRAGAVAAAVLVTAVTASWMWWDGRAKAGLDPLWQLTAMNLEPRDAAALARLETALDDALPAKQPDDRLLVATWNIRDFQDRAGARLAHGPHDFTFIAAILSRFDIVAVQEMRGYDPVFEPARDALLDRLGRHWAYVGSGVTEGQLGNRERLGFFYDRRAVAQEGGIDELVLAPEVMEETGLARQVARTPIVALFDFADQRLRLANAHIVFGGTGSERDIETAREFDAIVRVLRASGDRQGANATILLGDLNFQDADVPQADLAGQSGFRFPAGLRAAGSAAFSDRPYDQILTDWDPEAEPPGVAASGVFAIFDHVYRDTDFDLYRDRLEAAWPDEAERLERRYQTFWRTWRISDHRPKWIELDFGEGR